MTRLLLLFILLLTVSQVSFAVRVANIYKGEIPVASQATKDRDQALPQALAQVLVKVSGNSSVLNNPSLKSRLNSAPNLLQAFGYLPPNNPAYNYLLEAQFYAEGVNKLLRDTSTPIWGPNRPLVLAWVEFEEPERPGEIIDSSSQSETSILIKQNASRRAVPIIFPVMDVTDLSIVNVNHIATMDLAPLQVAAKRYSSPALVVLRVFKLPTGFSSQAKLVVGNEVWDWNIAGNTLSEVMKVVIDNVADKLGSRFASVVTNAVQESVTIKVKGVAQQNDYAKMMLYVQHLPQVASANVMQISGDEVILNLSVRGSRESLTKLLSVGSKLTPIPSLVDDKQLAYQWNQ